MYASQSTMRRFRIKTVAFHERYLSQIPSVSILAAHNMTQARIAETEKYAHVTFFFNGGVEAAEQRRRPHPGKIPESSNLRSETGDECI